MVIAKLNESNKKDKKGESSPGLHPPPDYYKINCSDASSLCYDSMKGAGDSIARNCSRESSGNLQLHTLYMTFFFSKVE